jgi:hypothetical protein
MSLLQQLVPFRFISCKLSVVSSGLFIFYPLSDCRAYVRKTHVTHRQIEFYIVAHKKDEAIKDDLEPSPLRPNAKDHWQRTPEEARKFLRSSPTRKQNLILLKMVYRLVISLV